MPVSIRLLLITMLGAAATAGCGPLPAGTPPASPPVRAATARNAEGARTPADGRPSAPSSAAAPAGATSPIALTDDYEGALARAEAEGKPLLLFFTAPWCEYCRRLEGEVLATPEAQAATAHFVCVRVDFARRDLHEQYRVKVFPTIIPATSRGTASQRLTGAQSVETFVAGLTTALTAVTEPRPATEGAIQR